MLHRLCPTYAQVGPARQASAHAQNALLADGGLLRNHLPHFCQPTCSAPDPSLACMCSARRTSTRPSATCAPASTSPPSRTCTRCSTCCASATWVSWWRSRQPQMQLSCVMVGQNPQNGLLQPQPPALPLTPLPFLHPWFPRQRGRGAAAGRGRSARAAGLRGAGLHDPHRAAHV